MTSKKTMFAKLNQKDVRALKIGAVAVIIIIILAIGTRWLDHWKENRNSLKSAKAAIESLKLENAKQEHLRHIVPCLKVPVKQQKQQFLFRDELNKQLKKAGITSGPVRILPAGKPTDSGYKLLSLQCSADCNFRQLLQFLAGLNENPCLVGVEQMKITCDKKERQKIKLYLTVSTFVK